MSYNSVSEEVAADFAESLNALNLNNRYESKIISMKLFLLVLWSFRIRDSLYGKTADDRLSFWPYSYCQGEYRTCARYFRGSEDPYQTGL